MFDSSRDSSKRLRIHESQDGNIYVDGAITHQVKSEEETLEILKRGALSRSVGSTNMNAQSSRSHAIFTLIIVQQRPIVQVVSFNLIKYSQTTQEVMYMYLFIAMVTACSVQ